MAEEAGVLLDLYLSVYIAFIANTDNPVLLRVLHTAKLPPPPVLHVIALWQPYVGPRGG